MKFFRTKLNIHVNALMTVVYGRYDSKLLLPALLFCLTAMSSAAKADCTCGFDDGLFTFTSITLDGDMSDWSPVLADPDNNTCDGGEDNQGNMFEPQPDRDAPVQSTGRDLVHFAWTWDSYGISTYTRRAASGKNVIVFIYYAETDNDGLMETGEPVVVVRWKGNSGNVEVFLALYEAANPNGDPMIDANGYADGYTLPGTLTGLPSPGHPDYAGEWGSADGLSMEWSVSWSDFGISAGTAFTFHVSSSNTWPGTGSFPACIDDNLAGCGGGAGSTQFADFTFSPDRTLRAMPATTVYAAHSIENLGNGTDTFNFTSELSGAHTPTMILYADTDNSGTFSEGDYQLIDTDSDGLPDTGTIPPAGTMALLIAYTVESVASGNATALIHAFSSYHPGVSQSVTDIIFVPALPDLIICKNVTTHSNPITGNTNPKAIPGASLHYTITATNTGEGSVDADTTVIKDSISEEMELFVGDINGSGSGPIVFTDGVVPSGLTYTFTGLTSAVDDVAFSNDDGNTFAYQPTPGPDGYDPFVTHIRVNPKGTLEGAIGGNPSFSITFRVRVH